MAPVTPGGGAANPSRGHAPMRDSLKGRAGVRRRVRREEKKYRNVIFS